MSIGQYDDHVEFSFKGSMACLKRLLSGIKKDAPHYTCGDCAGDRFPIQSSVKIPPVRVPPLETEQYNKDPLSPAVPDADPDAMSIQTGMLRAEHFDFNRVPLDPEAWDVFVNTVHEWQVGFQAPLGDDGKPIVPQPDRVTLLERIGVGRWPIFVLKWVAHYRCLQEAVLQAMETKDPDIAEAIAMTIVQISNTSFPDIADFYDHSTRWRRSNS